VWTIKIYDERDQFFEEFTLAGIEEEAEVYEALRDALSDRGYDPTISLKAQVTNAKKRTTVGMLVSARIEGRLADPWTQYRNALRRARTLERVGLPVPEDLERSLARLKRIASG
jgi:hypothetical protein